MNGDKTSLKTLKVSAGVKIHYTVLAQTTGFCNFNVKPGQGKPSKKQSFFISWVVLIFNI